MRFYEALSLAYKKEINEFNMDTEHKNLFTRIIFHKGVIFRIYRGIKFKCIKCGNCCTYEDIPLSEEEVNSGLFKVAAKESDFSLSMSGMFIDKETNKPCPYFDKEVGCTIYDNRPTICKKYPWEIDLGHLKFDSGNRNQVILVIDNGANKERMCQGFHLGEQVPEDLEDFAEAIKEITKRVNAIVRKQQSSS